MAIQPADSFARDANPAFQSRFRFARPVDPCADDGSGFPRRPAVVPFGWVEVAQALDCCVDDGSRFPRRLPSFQSDGSRFAQAIDCCVDRWVEVSPEAAVVPIGWVEVCPSHRLLRGRWVEASAEAAAVSVGWVGVCRSVDGCVDDGSRLLRAMPREATRPFDVFASRTRSMVRSPDGDAHVTSGLLPSVAR